MILLKLTLTKGLPDIETRQSELAIERVLGLLSTCATAGGNELQITAFVISLVGQAPVQEISKPRHDVRTRMSASLVYEMILSALASDEQKAEEQRQVSKSRQNDEVLPQTASRLDSDSLMSGIFPLAMDEWIASSGHLIDSWRPLGIDTSFWDTFVFDQVSSAVDNMLPHVP